jgi:putative acetyltransferase
MPAAVGWQGSPVGLAAAAGEGLAAGHEPGSVWRRSPRRHEAIQTYGYATLYAVRTNGACPARFAARHATLCDEWAAVAARDPMTIRSETSGDFAAIENIHIAAFANHPYSKQTEHLIVDALRADHALTISLVAELNGEVVGHIAFSPIKIDGKDCAWFILGPIGVLPGHQRHGIGQELVREGIEALRALGAEGCVLVGDPAYYSRLEFIHTPELFVEGVPAENFMCLPMTGHIPHGCISCHAAFSVTA